MSEKADSIRDNDTTWMLVSTTLVMFMIPGIGFFYSGLVYREKALPLIMTSILCLATVSVQWWLFGYSLTFSPTGSMFIGNFKNVAFHEVGNEPSHVAKNIPTVVFAMFQGMFAAFTPAIIFGSGAERGRVLPFVLFVFIWTTFVYDPIASWSWSPNGWSKKLGGLDFAGGTPVHITSGAAALAYCLFLDWIDAKKDGAEGNGAERGIVQDSDTKKGTKPHDVAITALGTAMLWFGWFGFNGGSTDRVSGHTAIVWVVTNLAASFGGITWMMLDYFFKPRHRYRLSVISFCSGAIAGLVCITPGAGYVAPWAAVLFGILGGVACRYATKLKKLLGFGDELHVVAIHGIGGLVGNILTGVFAQSSWVDMGNENPIKGGLIDGHPIQVAFQLAHSTAGFVYSFVATGFILWLINVMSKVLPWLSLRTDEPLDFELVEADYQSLGRTDTHSTNPPEAHEMENRL